MQWSITLGKIAGTAVKIHLTFLIFLLWIALTDYSIGGAAAAWSTTVFVILVFACVLAHEFGHILTGRAFGIRTPEVTLFPIGGVASMERMPDDPRQELLIAVAGPLVNVAIAAVLILGGGLAFNGFGLADLEKASLVQRLAFTNVALVMFNMVPAFPMDGGRVLRALLAMRLGARQATSIAARLGQVFAFIFVAAGLFYNPMLIFVGLFVYIAAVSEQQSSEFRWFAHDLTVAQGMERAARSLVLKASLGDAAEALLATAQREFAVVDPSGHPVGLLDRDTLLAGLKEKGPEGPVADVMGEPRTVPLNSSLEDAVNEMNRQGRKTYVVVDEDGKLAGLLTRENIAEMIMIHAARPDWKFPSPSRQPWGRV